MIQTTKVAHQTIKARDLDIFNREAAGVVHPGPGWSGYIEGCDHHDHPRFRWI